MHMCAKYSHRYSRSSTFSYSIDVSVACLVMYAGTAWDELKHIRQAVGFLVLNMQQLYRISTMYWDEKYGTHSVSSEGYVEGISATGMQSNHGFDGQVNACWTHRISKKEVEVIGNHGLLISVIHGRCDMIAQISHAKRLAHRLYPLAKMVELPGGHLVSHERSKEVNEALLDCNTVNSKIIFRII
uniref:AB hydrolase-1 domain-containing protein n=1 Tax=Lactuca sativa TaxID=4236 RepID=A0A9R1UXG2_LACSA|nr:hypothetical protein LSAT_V11C800424980 [Lactuca sativa]